MAFAGTASISTSVYRDFCVEIFRSFERHGFEHIYIINGHGANLDPLRDAANTLKNASVRIKSWWDFSCVAELRSQFYGSWEGMHATPSEIAITQTKHRTLKADLAKNHQRNLLLSLLNLTPVTSMVQPKSTNHNSQTDALGHILYSPRQSMEHT